MPLRYNPTNLLDDLNIDNASQFLPITFRNIVAPFLGTDIDLPIQGHVDFNALNLIFRLDHMARNKAEKDLTLSAIGGNAYADGDGDNTSIPVLMPSYAKGYNYGDFVIRERADSKGGILTTRDKRYWDLPENFGDEENTGVNGVMFSRDEWVNRNSILAKTRRLWQNNKIKSIISEFHTNGVKYEGQVATQFGESRGRNLLTYAVENGAQPYTINGYDNPYCRVWTNHHRYARFMNTMRADSGRLNYWGENFEIDPKNVTEYGDGENYDYAWRGKHNQDRRAKYSVLDTETGLVKIAPKFMGGGENNLHTKSCMFSIENLAWKDYDPYSFEQALSWEQRGPLGGRIMWFPPYGLSITETTAANWNGQDFIGRGEKVYTYVNTERSGNLTFLMLTDHPSSVDYASWYNDAGLNTENDYHRYFAGCNDGKPADGQKADFSGNLSGTKGDGSEYGLDTLSGRMNNDMLIKKPTLLTDEFVDEGMPDIVAIRGEEETYEPDKPNTPESVTTDIQFLVFFPNNYSGYYDRPTKDSAGVDAIAYLLAGVGAQVSSGQQAVSKMVDIPIDENNLGSNPIGYEMDDKTGITVNNPDNVIKTHSKGSYPKWHYRIDAKRNSKDEITYGADGYNNMAVDVLKSEANYKDNVSFKFNNFDINSVGSDLKAFGTANVDLYSFAEIAAAVYGESSPIYTYLTGKGVSMDRVKKLNEIFTMELAGIDIAGYSNSHGNVPHNKRLAINRGNTILNWLKKHIKVPANVNVTTASTDSVKVASPSVDGRMPKLYRSAKVVLHFKNSQTVSENQTDPKIGYIFLNFQPGEDGSVPEYIQNATYRQTGSSPEQYHLLTAKPDDWDTNYGNYYIKTVVRELDEVAVMDHKIHEEPESTYKNYVGFEWVKNKVNADGTIWNYYRMKQENLYFEDVAKTDSEDGQTTQGTPVTLSETQIFDMLTSFIRNDSPSKFYYKSNQSFMKIKFSQLNSFLKPGFNIVELAIDTDNNVSPSFFEVNDFIEITGLFLVVNKNFEMLEADGVLEYVPWPEDNIVENAECFNILKPYENGDVFYTDSGAEHIFYRVTAQSFDYSMMTRPATVDDFKNGDSGPYDPNTHYSDGIVVYKAGDSSNEGFYVCVDDTITHNMSWIGTRLIDKSMEVLGYTETKFIELLRQKAALESVEGCVDEVVLDRDAGDMDVIWGYGDMSEYDGTNVTVSSVLATLATEVAGKIDANETAFISTMLKNDTTGLLKDFGDDDTRVIINSEDVKKYIGAKRILDLAEFVDMENGETRNVETGKTDSFDDMVAKSLKKGATDCDTTLWVDMGDGILVQECYINPENRKPKSVNRVNEGNKIRYDQEYYFYKRYMADHPFVFEKLQEKVKYFEPAFHSMTPEGFNARLTFLEQCTRQGNTKTMSDQGGKTANNLAFGRPPFCVLRLGDFYNQMIVIDNISKDYSVSDGLQWDLNTEGNGVQPMLCKVTISFKFIGGGDITGPVRRLQNAMSFNYYANTSFYDNRADRAEYQPTNYETMGGAGNNQLDYGKSYAYTGKMYSNNEAGQRELRIKKK